MFSKVILTCRSPFIEKVLFNKTKSISCSGLNSFGDFAKLRIGDEFARDNRKELNIYKTFTAKLRPDLVEESKKFNALYPDVKREITSYVEKCTTRDAAEHVGYCMDYNVLGGKQFRVMQIIMGYKQLTSKEEQTPEKMLQLYMICWALELATSTMVIHDDLIDGALVRRGKPCWHTLDHIGPFAIVDNIMSIHSGFFILKNHCQDLPSYPRLFEAISFGVHSTMIGQVMDHYPGKVTDFNTKTLKSAQTRIVSDFLFYTPMSMLMALTGYDNCESIKHICDEMGNYHQGQNDFLDVFNVGGILQKTGHDIEIGKYSWLSTTCMERANDAQKQIMIDNYGKKDPECIQRVKQLYVDMNMQQVYEDYAYEQYDSLRTTIAKAACDDALKSIFYQIVDLMFHRATIEPKTNQTPQ